MPLALLLLGAAAMPSFANASTLAVHSVLEGTETHTEGPLVTGTWSWRLVPDR